MKELSKKEFKTNRAKTLVLSGFVSGGGGNLGFPQGFWADWWSKSLVNKLFCGYAEAKRRRGIVGFVERCFGEVCQNRPVMLNLIQHLLMLINTINIDRLRVEPAMTERFPSICEREQVSCAKRTEKNLSLFTSHFSREGKRVAFTLAEVLITLGIIGVVAAITLPSFVANVTERINSNRQANIAFKITQATDKMKAMGLLTTFASTDDFVDELQKHIKVAKRCDANHIADCWPTATVTTSDGEEFEVKNAKTGKNLNIKGNTTNNVGLVLADGSSLILTYNQDSQGMDTTDPLVASNKSLPVGGGKSQDFAYTTNSTSAIDFVMDVNGRKGPNSETRDNKYHDIRSFKVARFSKRCDAEIPGIGCVVNLGTSYDCVDTTANGEYAEWDPKYQHSANCWAGAKVECAKNGMTLPTYSTLNSIWKVKKDYSTLPQDGYCLSSSEYSYNIGTALVVNFSSGNMTNYGKKFQSSVLCVGN